MKNWVPPKGVTLRHYAAFLGAWITLAECQVRLLCQSFDAVREWASRQGSGTARVTRLTWSVEAAAKRQHGATCLIKALALQRLLSRNRHQSELHIGVDKSRGTFKAHAWLIYDGTTLTGGQEQADFTPLAAWPVSSQPQANKHAKIS